MYHIIITKIVWYRPWSI